MFPKGRATVYARRDAAEAPWSNSSKNEWIAKLTDSSKFCRCAFDGALECSQWDQSMRCAEDLERDRILKDRKNKYFDFIYQLVRNADGFVRRALMEMGQSGLCMPCFGRAIFDILLAEDMIGCVQRMELPLERQDPEFIDQSHGLHEILRREMFPDICTHVRREQSYGLATLFRRCIGEVYWKDIVAVLNFAKELSRSSDDPPSSGDKFFKMIPEFSEDMLQHREQRVDLGRVTELVLASVPLENNEKLRSLPWFVPKNMLPRKGRRNHDK